MAASPGSLAKQRARSDADKARRRGDLLTAAAALLAESAYERVTLATVARAAGLSKASAYTYFPTKESLFLALLRDRLERWREALAARITPRTRSPRSVARAIAETLADDPCLRELLGRLHTTLEVNVPDAEILAFKAYLAGLVADCALRVERACPGLAPGRAAHLFLLVHSLVIGLGMACTRLPNVSRALAAAPELEAAFEIDFTTELARVVELILRGWLADAGRADASA